MNTRIAAVVLALSSVLMPLAAHAGTRAEFAQEAPVSAQRVIGEHGDAMAQPSAGVAQRMGWGGRGYEQRGRFEGRRDEGRRFEGRRFEGRRFEGRGFEQGRWNGRR